MFVYLWKFPAAGFRWISHSLSAHFWFLESWLIIAWFLFFLSGVSSFLLYFSLEISAMKSCWSVFYESNVFAIEANLTNTLVKSQCPVLFVLFLHPIRYMGIVRTVLDGFWNPNIWLPPNITWSDLEPNDKIQYADHRHLFYPLPMALGMLLLRFFLEK